MSVRVYFSLVAREHVAAIDAWWRANRHAAPDLFADEVDHAVELLAAHPEIGIVYDPAPQPAVRRLLLQRTRFHVYYDYKAELGHVEVLAVWNARRGEGPRLW